MVRALGLVSLLLTCACATVAPKVPAADIETAPAFELKDQSGRTYTLDMLLTRGPAVLVFYRGIWSPHCRGQISELVRDAKLYARRGASLVGISADATDRSLEMVKKEAVPFRLLSDPKAEVAALYGARRLDDEVALPAVFIVGRNHRIHWRYVGKDAKDRPTSPVILQHLDDLLALDPKYIRPPVRR